jgi:hypothetical protein
MPKNVMQLCFFSSEMVRWNIERFICTEKGYIFNPWKFHRDTIIAIEPSTTFVNTAGLDYYISRALDKNNCTYDLLISLSHRLNEEVLLTQSQSHSGLKSLLVAVPLGSSTEKCLLIFGMTNSANFWQSI